MATKAEISLAITAMAMAWRLEKLADETVDVYAECLADLPGPVLAAAVKRLICTAKFFPAISEIRSEAACLMRGSSPLAHEAWGMVIDEVRRIGSYGEPNLPPAIANCVRAIGGWRRICMAESDEQMSNRSQFIRAYEAFDDREQHEQQLLPGVREVPISELLEQGRALVEGFLQARGQ